MDNNNQIINILRENIHGNDEVKKLRTIHLIESGAFLMLSDEQRNDLLGKPKIVKSPRKKKQDGT